MNRTPVKEVQALCTATVLDQQTKTSKFFLELARRFERRSRTYEVRALPTELRQQDIWSGRRESNSRHQLGRLRHQPLYHARSLQKTLAGDEGLEPSSLDLEASVLAAGRISRKFLGGANGN